MSGFSRWRLDRREGHYLTELAAERQQGKVVYLTSESEEVLQVDETLRNPLSLTCTRRVTSLEGPLPTNPPVACVSALGTNPLTLKELGLAVLPHPLCPPYPPAVCSSPHPQPTQELDPTCYYVIGGLVDHNKEKGLTHRLATKAGLRTARLPIDEHMQVRLQRKPCASLWDEYRRDRTPALWGMYRIKVTQSYGLYLESKS
eukprot:scaffold60_cov83-Isochrysis_galbana.AAC.1